MKACLVSRVDNDLTISISNLAEVSLYIFLISNLDDVTLDL